MHFQVQDSFVLHNWALSSAKAALLLVWSCIVKLVGPEWALSSVRHKYWTGHGNLARTPCFSFCSLHLVLGVSKCVQSLDQQNLCFLQTSCSSFSFLFYFYFFFFFLLFFNFTILYWFCHISSWIRHRYTCVPHPEPSSLLPPHTIPLGRPSALAPSIQYRSSNLDWWLVSYMILFMFQYHSPKSSHPLPLPQSPQDCSINQCLFIFKSISWG